MTARRGRCASETAAGWRIGGILLAAGEARRFGANKLLTHYGDNCLIENAMKAMNHSLLDRSCVVLGARIQEFQTAVQRFGMTVAENDNWRSGIGSSIKIGVGKLVAFDAPDAIMISVSDQPFLNHQHIDCLIREFAAHPDCVIATEYSGQLGVPAIFPRRCFDDLLALPNNEGAKSIIYANLDRLISVENSALATDIDTPHDMEKLKLQKTNYSTGSEAHAP